MSNSYEALSTLIKELKKAGKSKEYITKIIIDPDRKMSMRKRLYLVRRLYGLRGWVKK